MVTLPFVFYCQQMRKNSKKLNIKHKDLICHNKVLTSDKQNKCPTLEYLLISSINLTQVLSLCPVTIIQIFLPSIPSLLILSTFLALSLGGL